VNAPPELTTLLGPILADIEQVERLLQQTIAQAEEPLRHKLQHALAGGKRFRPALVILSGQLFAPSGAPACRLAAAIEMLHTATLIHDDVVDRSPQRRGKATLHTLWPAGAAVLAGDYLMALSIAAVAELGRPRLLEVFAQALCAMAAGEIRQAVGETDALDLRNEYYQNAEAKTASLCAAATEMAGILGKADGVQIAALRRFGRTLGLAFQIADDVLDVSGEVAQLGKPTGSDLRQGRITLPTVCYLEQGGNSAAVQAMLHGSRNRRLYQAAIRAVRASGAADAAMAEARSYAQAANTELTLLPDTPARRTLAALVEYVVERRR